MNLSGGKLQESGPRTQEDCPPRKTDLNSSPDSAQRPLNRPVAGNPQSRFVNRVPAGGGGGGGRGGGGERGEGKAGAVAHWLEFGAVSAVPSSL